MKSINQLLLKQSLKNGLVTGILISLIPLAITWSGDNFLKVVLGSISISMFLNYFWEYRPNMKIHLSLHQEYGDKYLSLLNLEIEERGIKELLRENWFYNLSKSGFVD